MLRALPVLLLPVLLAVPAGALADIALPAEASLTAPATAPTFADELYAEGDWFRAIGEYRRQIFASTDPAERARLWLRVGDAYARAKRYAEASRIFAQLQREPGAAAVAGHACWRLAVAWLDGGLGQIARSQLAQCRRDERTLTAVGADRLELAAAAAWFEDRTYDKVQTELAGFETRHPDSSLRPLADRMRALAREGAALDPYSSLAAGLMSAVVPGLGQVYQGRVWDGAQAFVFVGALGFLTYALAQNEADEADPEWLLPVAVGTIATAFYAANVYGAANGARMESLVEQVRFNDAARSEWRRALDVPLP